MHYTVASAHKALLVMLFNAGLKLMVEAVPLFVSTCWLSGHLLCIAKKDLSWLLTWGAGSILAEGTFFSVLSSITIDGDS